MFTDEGRWRGIVLDNIKDILHKLDLDELDLILDFVKVLEARKTSVKEIIIAEETKIIEDTLLGKAITHWICMNGSMDLDTNEKEILEFYKNRKNGTKKI